MDASNADRVLIATQAGLVNGRDGTLSKVGDLSTDLMGFSIGPDWPFLVSGHLGAGEAGLMTWGLIESGPGGQTWDSVSLSGEADFHTLDAWSGGVAGFDGAISTMRVSIDGGDDRGRGSR